MPNPASRIVRYGHLVRRRKIDFSLSKYNLINPFKTKYDSKHLGSYAQWAGDLNATVVVVLKDKRCLKVYCEHGGKPAICTPLPEGDVKWKRHTNRNLHFLLQSIGFDIGLPHAPKNAGVYIADAVPFIGMGAVCKHTTARILQYTTTQYIVPLIELINPLVVISIGSDVTRALFDYYTPQGAAVIPDADPEDYLTRILCAPHSINNGRSQIFPVFHPSRAAQIPEKYGGVCRAFEEMVLDWKSIVNCE